MIEIKNSSFCYQNAQENALKDVSLWIKPGECVVLCGKSGCGKTTLARLLNGLIPSFFNGKLTGECSTFGLKSGEAVIEDYVPVVGSVFQNPKTQYFNIDTTAELAFPCENMGMSSVEIQSRVQSAAQENGVEALMDRNIFMLSGGEKQKIAFAAACMLAPKLLVLDEPTSNLDDRAIRDLRELIVKKKKQGVTMVIAEHRLAWLSDVADRFCFFENGTLQGQWSRKEFQSFSTEQLQEMGLRPLALDAYRKKTMEKIQQKPPEGTPLVRAEQLSVGYGKKSPVYEIADFSIYKGEIVGLMGHNGVGKSTFAKTLCGLLKPVSGEITPAKEKERLKQCFMVMQDVNYQLFSDSVREEVLLGAQKPELCEAVLESLGLTSVAERHPMSLSGGQKQRVAIASAMLSGKELIILDEPTSGLDYYHMRQVAELLKQLKESGAAVLVITHDEELAAGWCDRVVWLEKEKKHGI